MESTDPLIAPFWEAAEQKKLVTCTCDVCNTDIWYPEAICPHCGGSPSWRELGSTATLLSWTIVRRQINGAFAVPYIPAIVVPDDAPGVQLVTQLFLSDGVEPKCDMALKLQFRELQPLNGEAFIAPVYREVEN